MAFNRQRRTSDIANVVVADASRNVTLPADLTVTALVNAGLLKGNAAGKLVAAVAGTDFQSPISLTTTGTSGAATFVGGTLNIPQYQAQGSYITSLTGEATASGPGAASVTLSNAAVIGKVLTGLNITGGSVVATDTILTAFGKLQNQVNGLTGGVTYQGTWNASTNTPTLTSSTGTKGYYYVVSVAGSTNLNGVTDWKLGDWAIYNGTSWEKVDNTDAVVSVNGFTGAVSLTSDNVSEGSTNLYFTNTRARSAISLTTTGSSGASTYNSSTGALNIPNYTLAGLGGQAQLNGTGFVRMSGTTVSYISGTSAQFVKADGSLDSTAYTANTGTVTSVALATGTSGTDVNVSGSPITTSGTITLNIPDASSTARGLITTGTQTIVGQKTLYSGTTVFDSNQVSTLIEGRAGGTLYGGIFFGSFIQFNAYTSASSGFLWKNGASTNIMTLDQSGNLGVNTLAGTGTRMVVASSTGVLSTQAITTGTVTSVALATGSTGTDINVSGSPITSSGTITLNIPTASGSARGLLSSADWTTFNNKQAALTNPVTGTGASGQVAYFNGTTTVTGNNNFFWDITNSRLGIGINTPVQKLHVYGTTNSRVGVEGTTNYSAFQNINTSGNIYWGIDNSTGSDFTGVAYARFIYSEGAYPLITYVNGAERMRIASTGAATFSSTIASGGDITAPYDTTDKLIGIRFSATYYNGFVLNGTTRSTGIVSRSGDASDYIWFGTNAATERMRITNGGNLLVGTTNDQGYKLDVNGKSAFRGAMALTSGATGLPATAGGDLIIGGGYLSPTSGRIYFGDGTGWKLYISKRLSSVDTDLFTFQDNGNFGIGTNSPATQLHLSGSSVLRTTNTANTSGFDFGLIGGVSDATGYIYNRANAALVFGVNNAEQMRITTTGLGIGTASPSYKLDVVSGNGDGIVYRTSTRSIGIGQISSEPSLFWGSGTPLTFFSGSELMRITSDGNVGIGTTSPNYPLQVRRAGGAGSLGISIDGVGSTDRAVQYFAIQDSAAGVGAGHAFYYRGPSSTTDTLGYILDEVGYVGIGAASPDARLRVVGSYNGLQSIFGYTDGRGLAISTSIVAGTNEAGSVLNARGAGAGTVIFQTDGTERMRVNYDGNVGLGTTSPTSYANYTTLSLNGTSGGVIEFKKGDVQQARITNADDKVLQFVTDGSERMRITSGGNLLVGTTTDVGALLNVAGTVNVRSASPTLQLDRNGSYTWKVIVGNGTNYPLSTLNVVNNGNTAIATFLDNGNVGIGTTSPVTRFHVYATDASPSTTSDVGIATFHSSSSVQLQMGAIAASPYTFWMQTKQSTNSSATFPIALNPLGGDVGIGTAGPKTRAHISGSINSSSLATLGNANNSSAFLISNTDTDYGMLFGVLSTGSGWIQQQRVDTNATAYPLVIQPNGGNLLVGTTTDSGEKLQVDGAIIIKYNSSNNNYFAQSNSTIGFGKITPFANTGFFEFDTSYTTGGAYVFKYNGSEKMRINSAGNVGIGTTSPSGKLDVQGGYISNGNGTIQTVISYASGGIIGTLSNHDLSVYTNNTEKVRITSGGNLLVGTTTDAGYKMDVTGQFRATLGITETRIDPRSITTTSTATLTPDVSADDFFTVTAQAATITIANPTGTPVDGQKIIVRIKDNGSARTIQYGNQFRGSTDLALPTTTTVTKTIYLGFVYNSADTKWDLIAKLDNI